MFLDLAKICRFEKKVNLRKFDKHVTDVQINAIAQTKEDA